MCGIIYTPVCVGVGGCVGVCVYSVYPAAVPMAMSCLARIWISQNLDYHKLYKIQESQYTAWL